MDEHSASFGDWLRRRRRALDLTQAALADKVSCSQAAIKKIEAGERRPSRALAQRLAEHLGIPAPERAAPV
jgi:transcriptional regulator with XRE-family HTH domain